MGLKYLKIHFSRIVGLALLLFCVNVSTLRAEGIKIVSMELGHGLQGRDKSGLYGDLLRHVLLKSGIAHEITIFPFKRALQTFSQGKADCFWAIDSKLLLRLLGKSIELVESGTLFVSTQHIFTGSRQRPISHINELAGKSVAILNGSIHQSKLKSLAANVTHVNNQTAKVQMLNAGRVDAVIGWLPDMMISFRNLGNSTGSFDPNYVMASSAVKIVCHASPNSQSQLKKINSVIREFVESAAFRAYFAKYGASRPAQ